MGSPVPSQMWSCCVPFSQVMIDLLDEGGVFFLRARPTTQCIYQAAGMKEGSAGEGKYVNHEVWSSTQGRVSPAYGLAKQQVLETVSFLGLSLPVAFHVDFAPQIVLLQNFFLASCRKFLCFSGHCGSSCGKALGNYQHFSGPSEVFAACGELPA